MLLGYFFVKQMFQVFQILGGLVDAFWMVGYLIQNYQLIRANEKTCYFLLKVL